MKKLLQINTVINSGSTGRVAEGIGQQAIRQGWKSYIAYGRNDAESESHKINISNKFEQFCHLLLARFLGLQGYGSHRATRKLIKQIEDLKPDVIHLHNVHGYYLNNEILFNYLETCKIPIVWTLHDCWTFTGQGGVFYYKKKVGKDSFWTSPKSEYPKSWLFLNDFKLYKQKERLFSKLKNVTLVPVSCWLQGVMKETFMGKHSFTQIYNGIDLNVFKPIQDNEMRREYCLEGKTIFLGVANQWEERKGFNDFVKLSSLLKGNEMIVLVGVTKQQIKQLPDKIIGIEQTESIEELVKFYSIADIYVNLSWKENFPTTNIEALACGTPILTYNTGGSPEAVSEETGLVIEQGNINELRSNIDLILGELVSGKRFTQTHCRQRAEQYFDKNERFQNYIDLYNRVLNAE